MNLDGYSAIVPGCSKYCLKYTSNKITKMIPNTLGIMVFDNYYSAYNFVWNNGSYNKIIKRVIPINDEISTYFISSDINKLESFYSLRDYRISMITWLPTGTKCYSKILVLDEIKHYMRNI